MNETITPERKALSRKILLRIAYIFLSILSFWGIVGFLATIPVVGQHPYWRTLRAQPEDFGLEAEDVTFQWLDGIHLTAWCIAARRAIARIGNRPILFISGTGDEICPPAIQKRRELLAGRRKQKYADVLTRTKARAGYSQGGARATACSTSEGRVSTVMGIPRA